MRAPAVGLHEVEQLFVAQAGPREVDGQVAQQMCRAALLGQGLQCFGETQRSSSGIQAPHSAVEPCRHRPHRGVEQDDEEDAAWLGRSASLRAATTQRLGWIEALDAYLLAPNGIPRTGKPPKTKTERRDNWPTGLVTPMAAAVCTPRRRLAWPFAQWRRIISVAIMPRQLSAKALLWSQGFEWSSGSVRAQAGLSQTAFAITPHSDGVQSPQLKDREDLRRLPGLELLYEGVHSVYYNEGKTPSSAPASGARRTAHLVCSTPMASAVFDSSRYENAGAASTPKTGLAVAFIRVPTTDQHGEAKTSMSAKLVFEGSYFTENNRSSDPYPE
ncbi:hypothetical protein FQA39_LY19328 [Lamprigera yunnana]|nr:hypothetical protein FQA39_LY19328 [Lamprigera yunnana]